KVRKILDTTLLRQGGGRYQPETQQPLGARLPSGASGLRRVADFFGGDSSLACRARELWPSRFDDAHVRPALQEMGGEYLPQGLHRHPFAQAAAAQAERQAACKTFGTSGRSSSRPENSHRFGAASRQ